MNMFISIRFIICLLLTILARHINAQIWGGIHQDVGIYAILSNPAFGVNSQNKLNINMYGLGVNLSNNAIEWNGPFTLKDVAFNRVNSQYKKANGKLAFSKQWFHKTEGSQLRNAYIDFEVLGRSFLFKYNSKTAFGAGTRKRILSSVTNLDDRLVKIVLYGLDTNNMNSILNNPDGSIKIGSNISNINFNVNSLAYQEYFVTISHVLIDRPGSRLSLGGTPKFLVSSGYFHTGGNDLNLQLYGIDSIKLNSLRFSYDYSNVSSLKQYNANPFLASAKIKNNGFAFDIGTCYQIKKKHRDSDSLSGTNDYKLSLGLSVTDIGFVKIKKEVKSLKLATNSTITVIPSDILELLLTNGLRSEEALNYFDSLTRLITIQKNYIVTKVIFTPMMLNFNLDYNITNGFYLGVVGSQNLMSKKKTNTIIRQSYISLLPRWRWKWLNLSLPLTLAQDYSRFDIGLQASAGPLFFGTTSLKPLVRKNEFSNFQAYFGLQFYVKTFDKLKKWI